ncbi:hypothetical protein D3C87_1494360 [compost metagenome]
MDQEQRRQGRIALGQTDEHAQPTVEVQRLGVDLGGQLGHARSVEQGAQPRIAPQPLADQHHQMHRQQGGAAQGEEVVVSARRFGPAQRLGEQFGDDLFGRRLGRPARSGLEHRSGQRLAVQLAVGGRRQGVQRHDGGGDHIVGQARGQLRLQGGGVVPLGRDQIGDQTALAGAVFAGQHHRLAREP